MTVLVIGISLSVVDDPLRSIWSTVRSRLKCVDAELCEFVESFDVRREKERIKSSRCVYGSLGIHLMMGLIHEKCHIVKFCITL